MFWIINFRNDFHILNLSKCIYYIDSQFWLIALRIWWELESLCVIQLFTSYTSCSKCTVCIRSECINGQRRLTSFKRWWCVLAIASALYRSFQTSRMLNIVSALRLTQTGIICSFIRLFFQSRGGKNAVPHEPHRQPLIYIENMTAVTFWVVFFLFFFCANGHTIPS